VLIPDIDCTYEERAVVTYVPKTTNVWEAGRFEIIHEARGMKNGAYAVQLFGSIPNTKFLRKVPSVTAGQLTKVEAALRLGLEL
jgi:hypothetical protein